MRTSAHAVVLGIAALCGPHGCRPKREPELRVCAMKTTRQPEFVQMAIANRDLAVFPLRTPHVIEVGVYFHVVSDGDKGEVGQLVLDKQLKVLNAAFEETAFRFVERKHESSRSVSNARWHRMKPDSKEEEEVKRELHQGTPEDLNVYIASPGDNSIGWGTWPWDARGNPKMDGVVLLYAALPGGSRKNHNEGDKLVHEVGHWLGLYHTFHDGCSSTGDGVEGTPAEGAHDYSHDCSRRNTCNTPKDVLVSNYMDYSHDSCMSGFIDEQRAIMDSNYFWHRSRLTRSLSQLLERFHLL